MEIFDVTDPAKPKLVKFLQEPKAGTSTPKIQIADGIMITGMCQRPEIIYGPPPSVVPYDEGIRIWDVKDPENPKELAHWESGMPGGTHWNYYDGGRYVHLTACCPGFNAYIYRILDIADPAKPVEVGRWWMPEQWLDGFGQPPDKMAYMVHAVYVKGNYTYIAFAGVGMVILDISDITRPKYVGKLQYDPPFCVGGISSHTVIPFSKRDLAIVTSEGFRVPQWSKEEVQAFFQGRVPSLSLFGIADISDPANPALISTFPYPEVPPGYPEKNFTEVDGLGVFGFGVHNVHQPLNHPDLEDRDDRIYAAYYSAGLRVYDISDRFVPKEIAYYIAPDPKKWMWYQDNGEPFGGPLRDIVEHIIVDKRGIIYITHMQQGLSILRCKV